MAGRTENSSLHHVLDEEEIIELLRAAVDREGSQVAFAKRHGVDRIHVNRLLKGKKTNVTDAIARALKLRKVFISE
jgi:plasmid maintenance system antidote protein VapI